MTFMQDIKIQNFERNLSANFSLYTLLLHQYATNVSYQIAFNFILYCYILNEIHMLGFNQFIFKLRFPPCVSTAIILKKKARFKLFGDISTSLS